MIHEFVPEEMNLYTKISEKRHTMYDERYLSSCTWIQNEIKLTFINIIIILNYSVEICNKFYLKILYLNIFILKKLKGKIKNSN